MNWKQRIEEAKVRGKFSVEDKLFVASWSRCAVGEINLPISALNDDGSPKDILLCSLGSSFMIEVRDDNIERASELYEEIMEFREEESE